MRVQFLTTLLVSRLLIATTVFAGPEIPNEANQLLDASIAYHDPEGLWVQQTWRLVFKEARPDGSSRETVVVIDNLLGRFEYRTQRGEDRIEGTLSNAAPEQCSLLLNGTSEFSNEQSEKYRLTCDHLVWLRDYYSYLWGLPMKLRDPGTNIDPEVIETTYAGQPVLGLKVTYDETVGSDTWYFYLQPDTYALVGYRFYHDETKNDGEYITLEGEQEIGDLRIPKTRSWYTHGEDKYLGTDTLKAITQISEPSDK